MMIPSAPPTALITGASRGMGFAHAKHYLRQDWWVIATGTAAQAPESLIRLQQSVGERLVYQPLDIAQEASIAALASRIEQLGCTLDLVINNAGVSIPEAFDQWEPSTFLRQFAVNAVGPAMLVRAVTPRLRPGANVVNVTSGLGSLNLNIDPAGDLAAYSLSKTALNQLTQRLAAMLQPRGVTVVAINPGWVRTDMGGPDAPTRIDDAIEEMTATIGRLTPEQSGRLLERDGSTMPF